MIYKVIEVVISKVVVVILVCRFGLFRVVCSVFMVWLLLFLVLLWVKLICMLIISFISELVVKFIVSCRVKYSVSRLIVLLMLGVCIGVGRVGGIGGGVVNSLVEVFMGW